MQLFAIWRDSLAVFMPSKIGIFLFLALNGGRQLYRKLTKFWWLYALIGVCYGITTLGARYVRYGPGLRIMIPIFYSVSLSALLFLSCLMIRTSMINKDVEYLKIYFKKFWFLLAVSTLFYLLGFIGISLLFVPYLLFLFIYLDSDLIFYGVITSLKIMLKMILYNLPSLLIITLIFVALDILFYLFSLLTCIDFFLWYLLYMPIKVVIIQNFYLIMLHEQSKYYFIEP